MKKRLCDKCGKEIEMTNKTENWSCPIHEEYTSECSWCKQEAESISIDNLENAYGGN